MILNVSGRTDIVAFYLDWFKKRYQEGFVDVRNPFNPKLVSRIYFTDVDAIMFCTKNPLPIIDYLQDIEKPIIFHVTLTPYKNDIEPNVPDKSQLIEGIKKISELIGKDNLFIRYDPIFISDKYNLVYHQKAFDKMCSLLKGYVTQIIVSFIDEYKNVKNNKDSLNKKNFTETEYRFIGVEFSSIAKKYQMTVQTCFEERNLLEYGFIQGDCISREFAYSLTGKKYKIQTIRKERKCHCIQTVDIGVYNTCKHFCKYCYANFDELQVSNNVLKHNPKSSLLIGELKSDDIIKIRKN